MRLYSSIDISSYIINYSYSIGHPISNLKLQKLLYYCQAAVLVETRNKCFDSKIMAWEFGPVVVEAYQRYKEFGRDIIPNQNDNQKIEFDDKKIKISYISSNSIDDVTKSIINKVVQSYSKVSNPFILVKKTHEEDPWKNTSLNEEIRCDDILKYYSNNPDKIYGIKNVE